MLQSVRAPWEPGHLGLSLTLPTFPPPPQPPLSIGDTETRHQARMNQDSLLGDYLRVLGLIGYKPICNEF